MSAPNHQWPGTKKKQKLRPSISFLVVSRRIKKILADNYREFPVAHQWHHPLKEDHVFNVPRHPWPRTEKKHKLQPSISVLVVFGRINKITADNYREFPVAHQWQHLIKPGQCNVPKHPWPRTKNCSHRSLCLWSLAPQPWAGNAASIQPSVHSCLGNASIGNFRTNGACNTCNRSRNHTVPNHQRPRSERKQKLQPSIFFLVVSGRINRILADNYREVPAAHQRQHLMEPGQCNVPKHPWPGTKSCSHRFRCLWSLGVSAISSWPTIIESFLRPISGTT